jgi:hypothetical protein
MPVVYGAVDGSYRTSPRILPRSVRGGPAWGSFATLIRYDKRAQVPAWHSIPTWFCTSTIQYNRTKREDTKSGSIPMWPEIPQATSNTKKMQRSFHWVGAAPAPQQYRLAAERYWGTIPRDSWAVCVCVLNLASWPSPMLPASAPVPIPPLPLTMQDICRIYRYLWPLFSRHSARCAVKDARRLGGRSRVDGLDGPLPCPSVSFWG